LFEVGAPLVRPGGEMVAAQEVVPDVLRLPEVDAEGQRAQKCRDGERGAQGGGGIAGQRGDGGRNGSVAKFEVRGPRFERGASGERIGRSLKRNARVPWLYASRFARDDGILRGERQRGWDFGEGVVVDVQLHLDRH